MVGGLSAICHQGGLNTKTEVLSMEGTLVADVRKCLIIEVEEAMERGGNQQPAGAC